MSDRKETEIGDVPLDWEVLPIGAVANVTKLAGFEYTKHFEYVDDGEVIALRALNVREGVLDLTEVKRIRKDVSNALIRSKLFAGDILFTYVGANIGQFALVDKDDKYHLAPNICRIRAGSNLLPYFLYSYFRSYTFQEDLVNFSVGSSQPTMPMGNIRQIKVPVPPIKQQESIAEVFSSLDDKIDLLHRQNKTLESLAQTLFRQWFIEEADDSWEERGLDGIAEFLNGLACQKYPQKVGEVGLPVIKIRELRTGITDSSDIATAEVPEKYLVNDGDILFSWSGSLEVVIWSGGKGVLNQHLFKVTSDEFPQWFYYFWIKQHLIDFRGVAEDKATTMGHIQRHHLTNALVLVPSTDELRMFNTTLDPVFQKIKANQSQIIALTKSRDALLPKLMNGEVRVEN